MLSNSESYSQMIPTQKKWGSMSSTDDLPLTVGTSISHEEHILTPDKETSEKTAIDFATNGCDELDVSRISLLRRKLREKHEAVENRLTAFQSNCEIQDLTDYFSDNESTHTTFVFEGKEAADQREVIRIFSTALLKMKRELTLENNSLGENLTHFRNQLIRTDEALSENKDEICKHNSEISLMRKKIEALQPYLKDAESISFFDLLDRRELQSLQKLFLCDFCMVGHTEKYVNEDICDMKRLQSFLSLERKREVGTLTRQIESTLRQIACKEVDLETCDVREHLMLHEELIDLFSIKEQDSRFRNWLKTLQERETNPKKLLERNPNLGRHRTPTKIRIEDLALQEVKELQQRYEQHQMKSNLEIKELKAHQIELQKKISELENCLATRTPLENIVDDQGTRNTNINKSQNIEGMSYALSYVSGFPSNETVKSEQVLEKVTSLEVLEDYQTTKIRSLCEQLTQVKQLNHKMAFATEKHMHSWKDKLERKDLTLQSLQEKFTRRGNDDPKNGFKYFNEAAKMESMVSEILIEKKSLLQAKKRSDELVKKLRKELVDLRCAVHPVFSHGNIC